MYWSSSVRRSLSVLGVIKADDAPMILLGPRSRPLHASPQGSS